MRDAEKLMSRCIYLNILKATIIAAKENQTSSETLEKYVMKLESDKSSCGGAGVFLILVAVQPCASKDESRRAKKWFVTDNKLRPLIFIFDVTAK